MHVHAFVCTATAATLYVMWVYAQPKGLFQVVEYWT